MGLFLLFVPIVCPRSCDWNWDWVGHCRRCCHQEPGNRALQSSESFSVSPVPNRSPLCVLWLQEVIRDEEAAVIFLKEF